MKQRRPRRRKAFRQPPKRLPPASTPPLDWLTIEQPTPTRRASSPAMSGIVEPLPVAVYTADAQVGKAAQHEEMLRRTEFLESLIADLPEQPKGGPGHNRQPITQDDVHEIAQAIAVLKAQPVVPTAPDDVRAAASMLKKVGERLGIYL